MAQTSSTGWISAWKAPQEKLEPMVRRTGLSVDASEPEPIYRQIFDQIVSRIQSGAYPPNQRLPPTRTLARELGTHRNTVVRAYEDLEAAGFVRSTVGRGTYVAVTPARPPPERPEQRNDLAWSSLISTATTRDVLTRFDRLVPGPTHTDLINMSRMQPSEDMLPAELLQRCIDHALRTLGPRALGYAPREGTPRLRALIADDLARQGIPASAEDVVITSGSQQAVDVVARLLVNPGDVFLTDTLTYPGAIGILAAAGARLVGVPSDDQGPAPSALKALERSGAKGFYTMPSCHNPTGLVMTPARREALIAWSHASGIPLVEDDYGAELDLDARPPPAALRSLDGNVIYIGSFSKRLIPALRIGFVLCPRTIKSELVAIKHGMDLGCSALLQHALAEFLERGYLRAHIGKILPEYRSRLDTLDKALGAHLPREVTYRRPDKGVLIWLKLPERLHPDVVYEQARRAGVLVSPGSLFGVDPRSPPGVRLTFHGEPSERLREGAKRLGKVLSSLVGASARGSEASGVLELV